VSVVVACYRDSDFISRCVNSVLEHTDGIEYEVIVVNYGWSVELALPCESGGIPIRVVNIPDNIGYSEANNIGLRLARAELVAFLNNDTIVTKGWLSELRRAVVSDDRIAAAQSKLLLLDHPDLIDSVGHVVNPLGFLRAKGYLEKDLGQYDSVTDICILQPASCLIKKRVLDEIGFFDGDFFWGHEDTDFSIRAHLMGYRLVLAPSSVVYHKRSATLVRMPEEFIAYYSRRNIMIALVKNYQLRTLLWVLPLHLVFIVGISLWYLQRGDLECFGAVYRALYWILRNARSILRERTLVQDSRLMDDRELFRLMDPISIAEVLQRRKDGTLAKRHLTVGNRDATT